MAREHISLALRYAILRRDHFCCMYCGARPPSVHLHVDHYVAVANGGTNDERNLITACADCNLGKSDTETIDRRVPGYRYEPVELCECERPSCMGRSGRDELEQDCFCSGCHGCDICGLLECPRIRYSSLDLEHSGYGGCTSVIRAERILTEYLDADQDSRGPLQGALNDLSRMFRKDIAKDVVDHVNRTVHGRRDVAEETTN